MDNGTKSDATIISGHEQNDRAQASNVSNGHKRSLSGSLLSKLSFLRLNQASTPSQEATPVMDLDMANDKLATPYAASEATTGARAMSAAIQQQRKTRRRKGSLRKTALLGTKLDSRDRRIPSKSSESSGSRYISEAARSDNVQTAQGSAGFESRESLDYTPEEVQPSWFRTSATQKTARPSLSRRRQGLGPQGILGGDEMGTDDEELISLPRINTTNVASVGASSSKSGGSAALHFPASSDYPYSLPAELGSDEPYRSVHRGKSSPLATRPLEMNNTDEKWDYSETEWWGWIILLVTWLVFVVGMGSCFEVWSWAWDVGETPYAPPELEDDPTLPIVGYYPALIILTAVMSWVWVVVAWVGMKYFKHANISGDDS
ncbi:Uncharacterized protein PECH_006652 [Penicillium ucsense]|uniref:Uncharacterized protein n=1 Tax=Penicillium ucsense TaxID=2839758 RepID=A0A8J8WAW4_9EURO|nr:Uncharacterized protein PECM_000298 [Penicillium ucsense]KAF7735449.1 Uncharacterized protein PECH_006652 [Penicillium ucsense]